MIRDMYEHLAYLPKIKYGEESSEVLGKCREYADTIGLILGEYTGSLYRANTGDIQLSTASHMTILRLLQQYTFLKGLLISNTLTINSILVPLMITTIEQMNKTADALKKEIKSKNTSNT